MMRIKVDFNNLVRGGQVRVSLRRVEGTLTSGDFVEVYDPDAELECQAAVMDVDHEAGQLYLRPLWEEQDDAAAADPTGSGRVFVWDGHRIAPMSALATNLVGGTTLARTPKVVAPVLIETVAV